MGQVHRNIFNLQIHGIHLNFLAQVENEHCDESANGFTNANMSNVCVRLHAYHNPQPHPKILRSMINSIEYWLLGNKSN